MKILILSSKNHISYCKHILEELKTNNINSTYKDYNEIINNKIINLQEKIYLNILDNTNYKFKNIIYILTKLNKNKLYKYIKNYDLIITTNIFVSLFLTYIKKIPFIFIEPNYYINPFINKIKPNYYISINNTGIPISTNFIQNKKNIRYNLNINKEQSILLISENIDDYIVNELLSIENTKLIIVTGTNKKLFKNLKKIKNKNLITLGYPHNLNDLIYSSDIVISNPNGLLSTEIAVINKPLIHILPNSKYEIINCNYFKENKLSLYCNDINNIKEYTMNLLNNENLKQEIIKNQNKIINKNSGYDLIKIIKSFI